MRKHKGYKFNVDVNDRSSRYGFEVPIKTTAAQFITNDSSKIIRKSNRKPSLLELDDEKRIVDEFFPEFLNNNDIERFSRNTKKNEQVLLNVSVEQ